jgi:hypothetical protein
VPESLPRPHKRSGLSEIADEFRQLDEKRRREGLALGDAERYRSLFARLSDALAGGERRRRVDARQFLRVPFPMELKLRCPVGLVAARCTDFGGGGCAIVSPESLVLGEEVKLDGVFLDDSTLPLGCHAVPVWHQLASRGSAQGYGLRFVMATRAHRDEIDRVLYRALGIFLGEAPARELKRRKRITSLNL